MRLVMSARSASRYGKEHIVTERKCVRMQAVQMQMHPCGTAAENTV